MGDVADRLRKARLEAGFKTAAEFAAKHDIPQPTYALHESGGRGLKDPVLKDYAKLLGVREAWLRYGEGPKSAPKPDGGGSSPQATQPIRGGAVDEIEGSTRNLSQYLRPAEALKAGARDVPIWGYAMGGDGAHFIDQGARLGMAYRPSALEGVPDAFAIEIWDHSMHPALKHGHLALVHPNKRPNPGEDVLVTLKDGQALVKELVRRSEKTLVLKQYNPPKEIKIEGSKVAKVQLIVDSPRVRM